MGRENEVQAPTPQNTHNLKFTQASIIVALRSDHADPRFARGPTATGTRSGRDPTPELAIYRSHRTILEPQGQGSPRPEQKPFFSAFEGGFDTQLTPSNTVC